MPSRIIICRATPIAPDPRIEKIARALTAGGHTAQVVGWNMHGDQPADEIVQGIPYHRLPLKAQFGRGLVNITHQLRWQAALLAWLSRHRREYDIIHACDFDTVLAALLAGRLWGKPVVYDIFDFYAEMLRATPGPVKKIIRWLDFQAIRWADATLIADDSRRAQIAGSQPRRLAVIYNCLDDQPPVQSAQRPPASQLHLVYMGNLQIERGLLTLLDVLRRHPEWTLDLAGFGADEAQIRQAAQSPGVTWHGLLPYQRVLELSAATDLFFATYDPAIPNNRYASPNKLFEAMMLGKPIVVAQDTNMDRIVAEWDCGLALPYGDAAALEAALLRYQHEPELRQRHGQNARRAFEQTYNWPEMQRRLLALYARLGQPEA